MDEQDIAAVDEVLAGDWLTQGPEIGRFEDALCAATGAHHAVAFSSGTAALHAAVVAAGMGPGRHLVTSPLSFVASASCGRLAGAEVSFIDIDPDTLNVDVGALRHRDDVDALVAVHYAGLPVVLSGLGTRPGVVIEDAAHALGASTPDGPVGNCRHSDMCVFSFHPVKAITTGEGGAVTTNSARFDEHLRRFRSHGVVRRPEVAPWHYEVTEVAPNYRITDIQAALGRSQLRRLESFVARRNELAARYRALLGSAPVVLPPEAPKGWRHAYHLFPIQVSCRRRLFDALVEGGVRPQVHYIPIYRHPAYSDGVVPEEFPHTERAYEGLVSLPLYPRLLDAEQDRVAEIVLRTVGA